MILRQSDVRAVIAILEEEHESPEACVKALAKGFEEILRLKDSYGVRIQTAGGLIKAAGPWWGKAQVKGAVKRWGGTEADIYPLLRASFLDVNEPPIAGGVNCPECKHPWLAHEFPDRRGHSGCVAGLIRDQSKGKSNGRILQEGCGCPENPKRKGKVA